MKILDFVRKNYDKRDIIIKRKKGTLDFTIKTGYFFKRDLNISVDCENLCVGNMKIRMQDLKTIYIHKKILYRSNYGIIRGTYYDYNLEIISYNIKGKTIFLKSLSEEDLDKLDTLFEFFVYANEKDENKLNSNEYEFLIENTAELYDKTFEQYTEQQKNVRRMQIIDKEYVYLKTIPKKLHKKYEEEKYLIFESKYGNLNYIDIWLDTKKEEKRQKKQSALGNIIMAFSVVFAIFVILMPIIILVSDN